MILDRTNTSDESVTFYLDGSQYFSVSESQVGTSTWQAAFDHNLSIIFDLAMGGGYPNGVCGCTTPTSATTSGGTMSVAYVAAYQTTGGSAGGSGNVTGSIVGYGGLCIDDRSASTANFNPVQVYTCNGTAAQQWTVVQAGSTLQALGLTLILARHGPRPYRAAGREPGRWPGPALRQAAERRPARMRRMSAVSSSLCRSRMASRSLRSAGDV